MIDERKRGQIQRTNCSQSPQLQRELRIAKEAKQILDKFAATIEKVKFKEKELKKPVGGFREEGEPGKPNLDFRNRAFQNAPNKDEDCIIAEKKQW